jgi:hypothetical protein
VTAGLLLELLDFTLRCAFFAVAPFVLVFVAMLFPVSGAVAQIGLSLVVFFAGSYTRRALERWPVLRPILESHLAFEAFYLEHPPRGFGYYVLYPLLLPYWLWSRPARREFLLYKGYTLFSFGILVASLLVQYLRSFPPELNFRQFLPIAAGTLAVEAGVVLMFLMPIATSAVRLHQRRAPRRLLALLLIGLASTGLAAARLERRRDPVVSYAARVRLRLRSEARPEPAAAARTEALRAALAALPGNIDDIARDGKVTGRPLELARERLTHFYKLDEANAFDLWYSNQSTRALLVLYFESHRGHPPIWIAIDRAGALVGEERALPANAFRAMRRAAR